MAKHFAKIGLDNVVTRVYVVDDINASDEAAGVSYLQNLYGHETWKMCSKTGAFRVFYPGNGCFYDSTNDIFHQSRPLDKDGESCASWTLNTSTGRYDPPITEPDLSREEEEAAKVWKWDESVYQADSAVPKTLGWILV